jgi:hypothetical protein
MSVSGHEVGTVPEGPEGLAPLVTASGGLWGARPLAPSGWILKKEAPWHRRACVMAARGVRQIEISRTLGKSPQAVCNLAHQPFFQDRVVALIAEVGSRELRRIFSRDYGQETTRDMTFP